MQPLLSVWIGMSEILVFCTADTSDLAGEIASALVDKREAACVNIVAGIRSIYRWEGKVCDDGEHLLLIKTSKDRLDEVRATIRKLHTYDVPEIIAVPITDGDPDYLAWLQSSISRQ
jgi:periplasmic divalent cation tolerance protein